jgi:uncharacterized protein YndB with AHSA1/START domain
MPRHAAVLELPASRERVWELVAEPASLARWWPGIRTIDAHGRGLVPGARWHVRGPDRPHLIRSPEPTGELIVLRVKTPSLVAWQLTGDRLDVELRLEASGPDRTDAVLAIEGPPLIGLRRSLPRKALLQLRRVLQADDWP